MPYFLKLNFLGTFRPTRVPAVQIFYKLNIDVEYINKIFKFRKKQPQTSTT